MDEAWERAVESALEGDSTSSPRTLTLDGAVKCLHGRLPPPGLLERFQSLEHLSIANVGVSSLDKFPRLRNLQRLILSDNRIAGGLEFLVDAGLDSLRDLDLSNNRIQSLDDLTPLASLRLVSLDLYECPVTRVRDYRSRVFGMIRTLKYLDKMDADENERPETDDEEDDEEEEDEEEEEDPGSGEIDGEDRSGKLPNGAAGSPRGDDVVDVDEDDESDADEEETESGRPEANGSGDHHLSNGFRVAVVGEDDDEEEDEDVDDDDDEEEDQDPGEEIDAEAADEEDVVQVHAITDSDEEEGDGVEEEDDLEEEDDFDADDGEDEEDVEDEEEGELGSSARLVSTDGEIDEHDQGEEDEDGEIGEEDERAVGEEPGYEEEDVEGDEDEDDDLGGDFLVQQHIPQAEVEAGSDFDACNGEDEDEVDDDDEDDHHSNGPSSSSQPSKRKRGEGDDLDDDDDCVEDLRSSKHR